MFTKTMTISALAAMASAHILMTNPVPYGKSSLNNSPLAADGSDFPCKQRNGVYSADGASNVYAQGSKQKLAFQGGAVHGGGSCQVSVTSDLKPTKDSVWKVIKSIEGGCPAQASAGNLGSNAKAAVPYQYDFTVPQELAAGNYTLAWTWFNKIGNREMYMNCAPMAVTGSGGSKDFINSLPNMFVANIGNQCTVPDSKDVEFPNPGKDVVRLNGQTSAFAAPTGSSCQKGMGGGSASAAPTGDGSNTVNPVVPSATSNPSFTSVVSINSIPGGVFVTTPAEQPTPTPEAAVMPSAQVMPPNQGSGDASAASAPAPASAPTPAVAPATGGTGANGGHAAGSACSEEGMWDCIGSDSFQRCASGAWSMIQPMADGVSCQSGESADLKMQAMAKKRSTRRGLRLRANYLQE